MDINILYTDSNGEIALSSTLSPRSVTGIQKLVQQIVKVLLTTPGSDRWYPSMGGGLQQIISQVTDDNAPSIQAQIAIAVMNTERYLLDEQVNANINDNEKLSSLNLSEVYYDRTNSRWNIIIDVETFSGNSTTVTIA